MSYNEKRHTAGNLSDSDDEPDIPHKRKRPSESDFYPQTYSNTFSNNQRSEIHSDLNDASASLFEAFNNQKSTDDYSTSEKKPSFAAKLMKKMGHQDGKGLGRYGQGITAPINESNQKGRSGLGNEKKGDFDSKVDSWDFDKDPVQAQEFPEWLSNENTVVPELETLLRWRKIGRKKRILDDEYHFCSKETLKQVLDCKSIFDNLDGRDMRQARSKSNPFESISACFFQNRAAMKMANIDAVFDFQFTEPKYPDGRSKVESDEPFYFCDVCAGPGGFSEYVLWRKKWKSKGFGMTLKEENDFKLEDFIAGSPAYFETYYGEQGVEGDGDVTKTKNLKEFEKFVLDQTDGRGVHCFMADGGFSVEGNENIQEILSKQLYLCQFLCALSVLRTGGNFVCKIFDIFTPFSVGLIYLLYLCFDRVCVHKPVTSRPANSERYIVCEGAQESKATIQEYLHIINNNLNEHFRNEASSSDVTHIVSLSVLKSDENFFKYIKESNEKIGKIQCVNLKKIQAFASNKSLYDTRQADLFDECLKYWKIPSNINRSEFMGNQQPEKPRNRFQKIKYKFNPALVNPRDLLSKFSYDVNNYQHKNDINPVIRANFQEVNKNIWSENFKKCSIYDYSCAIGSGNLVLLLGCGSTVVYELELNSQLNCFGGFNNQNYNPDEWKKLDSKFSIELPRETLLLAEKCVEYTGQGPSQKHSFSIHIIDAFFIEGENMAFQDNKVVSLVERNKQLNIFVKAITKKSRFGYTSLRVRDLIGLDDISSNIFERLTGRIPRNRIPFKYGVDIPLDSNGGSYVYPSGLYFFKTVQSPWSIVLSKSKNRFYYYKSDVQYSTYEMPNEGIFAGQRSYIENCFIWKLKNEDIESDNLHRDDSVLLSKNDLLEKIDRLK